MKQKKDKRRALFVKARNIIRNNMSKNHEVIKLTQKTAPMFVRAFTLFQGQRQQLRIAKEQYRRTMNSKLEEVS